MRIRTDTTLDKDCVLKATVQVCTACMVMSSLTTCVNFNTPPLAHVCPFKAFKLHSVEPTTAAHVPSQPDPEKASALPVILARHWALEWAPTVVRQIGRSVRIHEISHCVLLLLSSLLLRCPCFAHCCHDPFIVRSASNFSSFPWLHSVCASVSMFTINTDICLLLFLVSVAVSEIASPSLHRISVYLSRVSVHISRPLCASELQPFTRSITSFVSLHLVVECGIHGLVEYESRYLNNIAVLKQ